MRLKRQQNHSVDFLFTLAAFLVYAGAMLMLVYMGAAVYKSVTRQMDEHYSTRTAQAYIVEKIRQNDKSGTVGAEERDGHRMLVLKETIEGKEYATYIYTDGGKLKELFVNSQTEISLDKGREILDLQDFSIEEEEDGFFRASIEDAKGITREFFIHTDSE